jgi:hypothetical protein
MTTKPKPRKEPAAMHWIRKAIRERIREIEVSLMFGPFPAPYKSLSDRLANELAILRSLLERQRKANQPRERSPVTRPRKPLWMRFQAQRTIPNICAMRKIRPFTNSPSRLPPVMRNSSKSCATYTLSKLKYGTYRRMPTITGVSPSPPHATFVR